MCEDVSFTEQIVWFWGFSEVSFCKYTIPWVRVYEMMHTFDVYKPVIIYRLNDLTLSLLISSEPIKYITSSRRLRTGTCLLKILNPLAIFSVRFHNFHLFLLKANMKSAQRFLYTFSIHVSMFHWTVKRNSNLYYSITTQTGQPPKLLQGFGPEVKSGPTDSFWTVMTVIQLLFFKTYKIMCDATFWVLRQKWWLRSVLDQVARWDGLFAYLTVKPRTDWFLGRQRDGSWERKVEFATMMWSTHLHLAKSLNVPFTVYEPNYHTAK